MATKRHRRILFFIGAGASFPYLRHPSGSHFSTEFLTSCLTNLELLTTFSDYYKELRDEEFRDELYELSTKEVITFVQLVKDAFSKHEYYRNPNFEQIIHIIDKAILFITRSISTGFTNIDLALLEIFKPLEKVEIFRISEINAVQLIPIFLREYIAWLIIQCIDFEQSNNAYSKTKRTIYEFYQYIQNKYGSISLYSLNYDPILIDSLTAPTPLIELGVKSDEHFNSAEFFRVGNPLCHLHGYVGNIHFDDKSIQICRDFRRAQSTRIKSYDSSSNRVKSRSFSMKGFHYNTQLITGLDKFDSFSENPFSSYVHRFARETYSSSIIILIGVGFEDYHLNSFLVNSITAFEKRIIFVNKMTPDQVLNGIKLGVQSPNLISNLISRFGDKITINGKSKKYGNAQQYFDLYQNLLHKTLTEYGHASLTNKMLIYIKGIEEFYNERDKFFNEFLD